ncbi:MAG: hypothetical protein HY655_11400 [Acidobacteria bacterium]|nr:hypothetical protein [Acidobacteriota bacterium]
MKTPTAGHWLRPQGLGFAVVVLYREVHELSRAGQAFTIVLLLVGVGAALYTFTLLATVVVAGGLPKRLQQRRQSPFSTPTCASGSA